MARGMTKSAEFTGHLFGSFPASTCFVIPPNCGPGPPLRQPIGSAGARRCNASAAAASNAVAVALGLCRRECRPVLADPFWPTLRRSLVVNSHAGSAVRAVSNFRSPSAPLGKPGPWRDRCGPGASTHAAPTTPPREHGTTGRALTRLRNEVLALVGRCAHGGRTCVG